MPIWVCLCTLGLMPSDAKGDAWTAKRVLVISSEAELEQMSSLVNVLSIHFQDLETEVVLEVVDYPPRDIFEQVSAVKALVQSRDAFSAIWVERNKEELFLFVADNSTSKVFLQTFQGSDDGWDVECDTIAVLARSALVGWLSVSPEQTTEKGLVSDVPEKRTLSTTVKRKIRKEPPPVKPLSFLVAAGYNPKLIHRQEPLSHSIHIGLGARLKEKAVFEVALHGGPGIRLKVDEDNVRFWHLPVYIKSGPIWMVSPKIELGLVGALVLDIARISGSQANLKDNANQVHPGLGLYGKAAVRLLPYLSSFIEVGTDFFIMNYDYTWKGKVAFRYKYIQPGLVVGFAFHTGRNKP